MQSGGFIGKWACRLCRFDYEYEQIMNSLVDYAFNAETKAAKKDSPILAKNETKYLLVNKKINELTNFITDWEWH